MASKRNRAFLSVTAFVLLSVFLLVGNSFSEDEFGEGPPSSTFPNLLTDICWRCVFPMRIGGSVIFNWGDMPDNTEGRTGNPDDFNPNDWVCTCEDNMGLPRIGIYVSFWEPDKVLEVVQRPWKFYFLFGLDMKNLGLPAPYGTRGGKTTGSNSTQQSAFYNVHMFKVPLLAVMDILVGADYCADPFLDIDLMYFTEVDPIWNNDAYATYLHPEGLVFANPLAQALCAADCLATTTGYPLNSFMWCAGCWGSMYPFTGHTTAVGSPVRETSLFAARLLARLARLPVPPAMELDTSSPDAKCGGTIRPVLKKSQYRFDCIFPIPQTKGQCCQGLGVSTFTWGEHRNIPATGEFQEYLLFRKRNCCLIIL